MLPSGDIVPATLVRNNKTGRVIPLVSVSPAPGAITLFSHDTSIFPLYLPLALVLSCYLYNSIAISSSL